MFFILLSSANLFATDCPKAIAQLKLDEKGITQYLNFMAQSVKNVNTKNKVASPTPQPENIWGRIIRGKQESDFQSMSSDLQRKLVFYTNPEGVAKISSKASEPKDFLRLSGYPDDYIDHLVSEGHSFKYIFFHSENILPATWEGIIQLVKTYSPEAAAACIHMLDELKSKSFKEIDNHQPGRMSEIYRNGREDPAFMSFDKFNALVKTGNYTPYDVRSFLFHEFNLNELFAGDGFTRTPEGDIGIQEFIGINYRMQDLLMTNAVDLEIE